MYNCNSNVVVDSRMCCAMILYNFYANREQIAQGSIIRIDALILRIPHAHTCRHKIKETWRGLKIADTRIIGKPETDNAKLIIVQSY